MASSSAELEGVNVSGATVYSGPWDKMVGARLKTRIPKHFGLYSRFGCLLLFFRHVLPKLMYFPVSSHVCAVCYCSRPEWAQKRFA